MKVLGISFGTKNGTNDSVCIEALMGAKKAGALVEFIEMSRLEIKHCTGCCACVKALMSGKGNLCVLKDDFDWLLDQMLNADGIIITDPIFEEGASGLFHTVMDRFGPRMDRGNNQIGLKTAMEHGGKEPDPRILKDRVISYIGIGGSDWGTRVQCEHATHALSPMWKIIDNIWFPWGKEIILDEERLVLVHKIGENLAIAARNKENATYQGERGVCPHCHNQLFYLDHKSSHAICALCGLEGELVIEGGVTNFVFPNEQLAHAYDTISGKYIHGEDIKRMEDSFYKVRQTKEYKERKKRHQEFISSTKR